VVKTPKISSISLDGGTLCLDYVNSVHDRRHEPLQDYLKNVQDLIAWSERVAIVDGRGRRRLETMAADNSRKGRSFFSDALALRELLYRIFFAITAGKKIVPADISQYNTHLSRHFSHIRLILDAERYAETWDFPQDSFFQITAPIVKDAHALLLSPGLERVKECPNCGWLFLDTTKNGKRRWCSMKNCGNSVKALEWYYRKKGA